MLIKYQTVIIKLEVIDRIIALESTLKSSSRCRVTIKEGKLYIKKIVLVFFGYVYDEKISNKPEKLENAI